MAYTPKTWRDYPSTETLVMASDLNRIEQGIKNAHDSLDNKIDTPQTAGVTDQVLTLGADGKPVWSDPTAEITVDDALSDTSENPVQNKIIKAEIDKKADAAEIKEIAYTGKDEDVTFDNTDTDFKATNVHDAIIEAAKKGGSDELFFDSKEEYEEALGRGDIPENTLCYYPGGSGGGGNVPTKLSELEDDSTHRTVTDAEKSTWNNKYTKSLLGIPKSDLSSEVQTSLDMANKVVFEYVDGIVYDVGELVFYENWIYKCKESCMGVLPTNTTYWKSYANIGALLYEFNSNLSNEINDIWNIQSIGNFKILSAKISGKDSDIITLPITFASAPIANITTNASASTYPTIRDLTVNSIRYDSNYGNSSTKYPVYITILGLVN